MLALAFARLVADLLALAIAVPDSILRSNRFGPDAFGFDDIEGLRCFAQSLRKIGLMTLDFAKHRTTAPALDRNRSTRSIGSISFKKA